MQKKNSVSRRNFVKKSITGAIGASIPLSISATHSNLPPAEEDIKIKDYRVLGRTGFKVSDISLGAGQLTNANVLEQALKMGINYIDTAEHYVSGRSEKTIGEVLKTYNRKSLFITTKLNLLFGGGNSKEELKSRFYKCLERLQTDYVDCFMIHMTSEIGQVKHEPFHELAEELKADGKIRFTGLSNHGTQFSIYGQVKDPMEKVIGAAVEDGRFDVALFVYNFLQKEQGERIIKACKDKNMGISLMKADPVNMGLNIQKSIDGMKESGREPSERYMKLANDFSSFVKGAEEFKSKYGLKSETEVRKAAIQFVLSNKDIHCVCPSINSFDQLDSFVSLSGTKLKPGGIAMLRDYNSSLGNYYCRHACGICESSCPSNIPINTIMRYNHYFEAQGREKHAISKYASLKPEKKINCSDCNGLCEKKCPYNVPVRSLLLTAHQNLTV